MLLTITSALLSVEIKEAALTTSGLAHTAVTLWQDWEFHVLILLSLCLQFVLAWFGDRRRSQGRGSWCVWITVWSAYMLADWVTTWTLSILSRTEKDQIHNQLVLFWTPFLLLHLGYPESISAYSLADNKLWRRHLLGLTFQTAVALYVFARFWTKSFLSYMCIALLIGGIIRYAERILVLYNCSNVFPMSKSLIEWLINEYKLDRDDQLREQYKVCAMSRVANDRRQPIMMYSYAYFHFKLIINPIISDITRDVDMDLLSMPCRDEGDTFKLVGIQLGLFYDILYTKKILNVTKFFVFRCIYMIYLLCFLIASSIHFAHVTNYYRSDIALTCALLVGAMILDLCSVIGYFFSLRRFPMKLEKLRPEGLEGRLATMEMDKSGIQYVAQHSLIDFAFNPKVCIFWDRYNWKKVDLDLKKFICLHLQNKFKEYRSTNFDFRAISSLLEKRGQGVLERSQSWNEFQWSVSKVLFTESLLIWHVATQLVFEEDLVYYPGPEHHGRISKLLSEYMMYLLLVRPTMFPPDGVRELRTEQTRAEYVEITKLRSSGVAPMPSPQIDPAQSLSVWPKGRQLKEQLQALQDYRTKWEIIGNVWMEMLCFATSQCRWEIHAEELRHGGELLTYVTFLMIHLGLNKQIVGYPTGTKKSRICLKIPHF